MESPRDSTRAVRLREEVIVAASIERVWSALVDLHAYAAWNPWLVRAEGEARVGAIVWAEVILGKKTMRAKHVVLVVDPMRRFCWRDAGWNALFVYAHRDRTLERLVDGRVRLRQELILDGPLKGIALAMYGDALRAGLAAETVALAKLVATRDA